MKIALLSFEYPTETGFGGIGTYTWHQARGLVKLGHDVHVLAGALAPTQLRLHEHDGVKIYRFRSEGVLMRQFERLDRWKLWWTKNRFQNAVSMYLGLQKLRRKHQYDIIEMPECGAEGALINHLTKANTIIKFHSPSKFIMPFYDVQKKDISFCSITEQLGIRGAQSYSSCSQFLAKEVREKLGVRSPIQVIPNGIDVELFDAAKQVNFRKKFSLPQDKVTIFFSGRMEPRKGIHLCKEIAASILERYDVAFVFVGQDLFNYMSDTLLPSLKTKNLKGSVHYLGKLDMTEIHSCLCQADIFLLPSLWENCPYSCLEAMAAGRAIVSCDQGGMPELIQNGKNGLVAQTGDANSFVACLERLIEDQPFREQLGQAARKSIEQSYTDVHIASLSTAFYQESLGKDRWKIIDA